MSIKLSRHLLDANYHNQIAKDQNCRSSPEPTKADPLSSHRWGEVPEFIPLLESRQGLSKTKLQGVRGACQDKRPKNPLTITLVTRQTGSHSFPFG